VPEVTQSIAKGSTNGIDYEFRQKIRSKFKLRKWIGELYVGKRMKMHYFSRLFPEQLRSLGRSPRILEVGSEDGCFTEWFSRFWPEGRIDGMDKDSAHAHACAQWAEENGRAPQLSFRQGNLLSLQAEQEYDAIFCLDVLGYIVEDSLAVKTLANALRKDGLLIVHQPNPTYRRFGGDSIYVPPEAADAITEGHVRHGYTPEEMASLARNAELEVRFLKPLHGRFSDLAHRFYNKMERPAALRILTLPIVDLLWFLDWVFPTKHGNTTLMIAAKTVA